jgi:hypothetical protein
MKLSYNGAIIEANPYDYEERKRIYYELECLCGHKYYQHAFVEHMGSILCASQCVMCDCKGFHIKEK